MSKTRGIDGASVAGIPDCNLLAAEGYAFGFPRIAFGGSKDPAGAEYLRRLHGAGMLARPYVYLRSWENAAAQADFGVGLARSLDEPFLWVDCEPAKQQNLDGSWPIPTDAPSITRGVLLDWLERADVLGFPVGVYGGGWYLAQLKLPASVAKLPLWVAHYGTRMPRVPAPWTSYAVWQSEGNVRRAGALVDLNESPFTTAQLDLLLGGFSRAVPSAPVDHNLGLAVAWSEAASGIDGSVERFVDREEGPLIFSIV